MDGNGNHYAQLVGRPRDPSFMEVIQDVDQALVDAAGVFPHDKKRHRRGSYSLLSIGISYGNGSQERSFLHLLALLLLISSTATAFLGSQTGSSRRCSNFNGESICS